MDTKLTLKLDQKVIERAKIYANMNKVSLSRLIENYLDSLTRNASDDFEISPFVKSISTGKSLPLDRNAKNLKEEYMNYLEQKHR